jgi:hypothetical protein
MNEKYCTRIVKSGARSGAVDRDTALQAGISRVQFPMLSMEFLFDIILPPRTMAVDSASNRNEYQEYFLGVKAAGHRLDNLTTFMSTNSVASTCWNPQDLSRPVQELLYHLIESRVLRI